MLRTSAVVGKLIVEAAKDVLAVVGTSQGILGPQIQEKIRLRIRSLLDNVGKAYKDEMGILEMPAEDAQAVLGEFLASIMPRAARRFPDPRQQEAVRQEISRLFNEELDKQGPWSLMQEPEDVQSPMSVWQGKDYKMNKVAGWIMDNCRFAAQAMMKKSLADAIKELVLAAASGQTPDQILRILIDRTKDLMRTRLSNYTRNNPDKDYRDLLISTDAGTMTNLLVWATKTAKAMFEALHREYPQDVLPQGTPESFGEMALSELRQEAAASKP